MSDRLMDRYGCECETKVKTKLVYDRDTGTTDAADIQPGRMWADCPKEGISDELHRPTYP